MSATSISDRDGSRKRARGPRLGRFALSVGVAGLLAGALTGCGRGQTPIPEGAQQIHVVVDGPTVRLDPATVRAGDIYAVLDTPGSSVGFAQRQRSAEETPGPLTSQDIDRLAHGDTEGTSIGGFDDTGCSPQQRAEDRGRMGPCGNVFQLVLTPGMYVFFTGNLDGGPPDDYSGQIAVLEVLP